MKINKQRERCVITRIQQNKTIVPVAIHHIYFNSGQACNLKASLGSSKKCDRQ